MFSLCGLSEAHCFETICPDVLKTRSEAALDALIIRYFLASSESVWYDDEYTVLHKKIVKNVFLIFCFISQE